MSYFWIIVYIIFVIFIVTMFSWSTIILLRQKKAWQEFAKKHDLVLGKGGFFESVAVEGNYKKNRISLFSQGKVDETSRGMVRYRTVIEVIFGYGMPGAGALGNMAAMRVVETLNFGPTYHPDSKDWNKNHLVTASNRKFIEAYLTPKRLEKLNKFFNMQNAVAMLVYDQEDSFLRVETTDPLLEPKKIEAFIDKLIVLADDLKMTDAEIDTWSEPMPTRSQIPREPEVMPQEAVVEPEPEKEAEPEAKEEAVADQKAKSSKSKKAKKTERK